MAEGIRRVLVTGGGGFIGSHLVEGLLARDYSVGVLDNFSTGSRQNLLSVERNRKLMLHEGDVRDQDLVTRTVKEYEAVIHLAALVSVSKSIEDPPTTDSVNTAGTLNLLRASAKARIQKFIFASSSSVYGEAEVLPCTETTSTRPLSPYGVSKLNAENYCRLFSRVFDLKTISLRYFNVYGPRQGQGPYSGVIPTFVKRIHGGNPPIIYGDGNQTRDFVSVKDVVQANALALEKDFESGEVMNIGTGTQTSVSQLAALIGRAIGKGELRPIYKEQRTGDIMASFADIRRARTVLGYNPEVTVQDGISELVSWFSSHPL